MINKIFEDYEEADAKINNLINDITKAVMNLAFGYSSEVYRFNQIGIIYQSIQQIIEARAEMDHAFSQVVDMVEITDDAKEGES